MKTSSDFQKEDYEKLLEILNLNDDSEESDNTDYFNAWNFGLRAEDCEFTISAAL